MSVLDSFGVSADTIRAASTTAPKYPKEVPGRVAHIDADFMAYQVSAESKAELDPADPTPRKTYEDMQHNAIAALDHIRALVGAEKAICHVTGKGGDKGGRDAQAMLQPYQANRADRDNKPENLDAIRAFIGQVRTDTLTGSVHLDQEADDAMATAAYTDPENAVVCSMDKDLWMVPGYYFDWDAGKVGRQTDSFGYLEIKEMVSPTTGKVYKKKLVGRGTKYFWAQLLMGDKADNISGLPACPGQLWQSVAGTKAYKDLHDQWIAAADAEKAAAIEEKLLKMEAKTKLCGDMLAYSILDGVKSDKEAYAVVSGAYRDLAKKHNYDFKDYRTDKVITPTQALFSEMQLLWMRRSKDPMDVLKWLKEAL